MTSIPASPISPAHVRRNGWRIAAAAVFVLLSGLWTAGSLEFGSGWIKTGSLRNVNSILGYSETERTNVVHKENRSFLQQISMFSGATSDVVDKFYIVRPAYAYAAAFLAPVFGIEGAALAMNWLAWALAAFCAWRLAVRLFDDELAGFIAVAFVGTGMGFVTHVLDFSAHLTAFATYYLGVVALYESDIWKGPQRWPVHLALGALFALCSLTYNTGVVLVLAYVALAFRHNRLREICLGAAVALTAQYAWLANLNLGYALTTGEWTWYNLYANEDAYLGASVEKWLLAWANPLEGLRQTIAIFLQFLSFESPLTVLAGLIGLTFVAWRNWRLGLFLSCLFALPIAAAMVYAQQAAARGYLVFGVSLVVYVVIAGLLAEMIRGGHGRRRVAVGLATVLLSAQIAWAGAHFLGQLGPIRAYFLGLENGVQLLRHAPTEAVSLTGAEERPSWFGGTATFADLGLYAATDPEPATRSLPHRVALSLASRGLISFYITLLIASWYLVRRRPVTRAIWISSLLVYALPSVVMAATVKETLRFEPIDHAGPMPGCREMTYSIRLSDAVRRQLASFRSRDVRFELFFRPAPETPGTPVLRLGKRDIPIEKEPDDGLWRILSDPWRSDDDDSGELTLTLRSEGDVHYLGWQRNGLPERRLAFENCAAADFQAKVVPAIELRVLAADGAPLFVGF